MNIQEALKPTGKVYVLGGTNYAEVNNSNELVWYSMGTKERECTVSFYCIIGSVWLPYHEIKEIRPEKEEETWLDENTGLCYLTFYNGTNEIGLRRGMDGSTDVSNEFVIHNRNGWTRLYPKVEDDSIERIEIEGVEIESCYNDIIIKTSVFDKATIFNNFKGNVTIHMPKGK